MSDFGSENLVFLISQPRAGSTMLQRILAGQPDIHTTAEPWLMLHPVYALRSQGYEADYDAHLAYDALQDFCGTLSEGRENYLEAIRCMAYYLYGTAVRQANKRIFLDKTPRYYLIIPELAQIFPQAKFIILFRNPLAILNSLFKAMIKDYWISLARYGDDLLLAPKLLAEAVPLLGDNAQVVHYEELVTDPENQVESICKWLGVEFQLGMLDYGQQMPPEGRMGDPSSVHKHSRPSAGHLDQWLEMGKQPQAFHFAESYLQALGPELVGRMGYDYSDLHQQLASNPPESDSVDFTWNQLFEPDDKMKKRLYYHELALIEHSRLVHWARTKFARK